MEIAGEIGISQAQVSRLEKCALKKYEKVSGHIIKRNWDYSYNVGRNSLYPYIIL